MNNKGQTLVLFVILLPVILLLLLITIEVGDIYLDKQKTKDSIKNIIRENLKQEPNSEIINELIEKNINNIEEKTVFTSTDEIRIYIRQERTIFGRKIKLEYNIKGIKENEIIKISEG